jgi:hypothetical protein
MGDKFHPRLNTNEMPIAYKYREGKMKRTLKRELKGTEIAEREAEGCSGYLSRMFLKCLCCVRHWQWLFFANKTARQIPRKVQCGWPCIE